MKIETQLSKRTVQHSLYQEGYNRRVVKKKIRIREVNRKKRVKWAREKLHWRIEGQWDRVIFSDESQVVVGNNNRIYIWRSEIVLVHRPRENYKEENHINYLEWPAQSMT
jgi:hypothetical protein